MFARIKAKKQHWMPLISALWDAIILKTHVSLLQWKHCMDSLPGNPQEHNHCEQTQFISASTGVNANLCHAEREKQINKVQTSCYRLWTWASLRKTQVKWKTLSRFNFVPNRGCCRVQTKDKNDHLQCYHCRMVRWHRGELTWSSCTFVISPLMLHSTDFGSAYCCHTGESFREDLAYVSKSQSRFCKSPRDKPACLQFRPLVQKTLWNEEYCKEGPL